MFDVAASCPVRFWRGINFRQYCNLCQRTYLIALIKPEIAPVSISFEGTLYMQLRVMPCSSKQEVIGRQLSNALRLESYFRTLLCDNHADEVFSQWNASRRLVTRALADYVAWYQRKSSGSFHIAR